MVLVGLPRGGRGLRRGTQPTAVRAWRREPFWRCRRDRRRSRCPERCSWLRGRGRGRRRGNWRRTRVRRCVQRERRGSCFSGQWRGRCLGGIRGHGRARWHGHLTRWRLACRGRVRKCWVRWLTRRRVWICWGSRRVRRLGGTRRGGGHSWRLRRGGGHSRRLRRGGGHSRRLGLCRSKRLCGGNWRLCGLRRCCFERPRRPCRLVRTLERCRLGNRWRRWQLVGLPRSLRAPKL
jgi:hypothetical protein